MSQCFVLRFIYDSKITRWAPKIQFSYSIRSTPGTLLEHICQPSVTLRIFRIGFCPETSPLGRASYTSKDMSYQEPGSSVGFLSKHFTQLVPLRHSDQVRNNTENLDLVVKAYCLINAIFVDACTLCPGKSPFLCHISTPSCRNLGSFHPKARNI